MQQDPKTKEALLDRLLSFDFDGDFSGLGEIDAQVIRAAHNRILMVFPASGQTYELVVRKPRKAKVPVRRPVRTRYRQVAAH